MATDSWLSYAYFKYEWRDVMVDKEEVEEILLSSLDPVSKVRRIMALGVEEEEANELVERYQIGQMTPVYYERLNFDEDEQD
jgi:hypothetical protein